MAPAEHSSSGSGEATRDQALVKVPFKDLKKKDEKDEDLSEEDLALKQELELYVKRVQDSAPGLQKVALESMRQEIRTATSSMTSVPKPLKFLRPHYGTLQAHFKEMVDSDLKKMLADILSVLALTMSPEGERESLKYRLLGSEGDIGSWGHEYVRNLAGEIAQEYAKRQSEETSFDDLMDLVVQIVAFHMKHNAEPEAVDLLMEVEDLDLLMEHVDHANYKRTCLYLTSSAKYLPGPDDVSVMDIAHAIYMKFEEYPRALQIALYIHRLQYVKELFQTCRDHLMRQQFSFILARHGVTFELDEDMIREDEEREAMQELINNSKLSEGYLTLARDIEVMEPKSPEDIYKAHLLDGRGSGGGTVDSARQNLAATFVNAFVNAGFGQDKLMTVQSEASSGGGSSTSWLFKNKEHGKTSAAASLGMILLWDVDSGLAQLDKYFHSTDPHVTAGALLGVGIVNCTVQNECDPALALLAEYVDKDDSSIKIGAIMGLGLAYAGTKDVQVRSLIMPLLGDGKSPLDVIAFAAISLALVFVGSCNEDVAQAIIFALMDRSELELEDPLARFLPLALGLLYLGKQKYANAFQSVGFVAPAILFISCLHLEQESVEATAEVSKTFNEKIREHCDMTLLSCAYAGTGNVLKVQHFLGQCAQHLEKGESYQGPAVLGIAMVAMAEELGLEMAIRSLEHLLQYGEQNIRRAVPLALGLLCISNPKVNVMDTLSRLSHDADSEVAMAATISLGLIGAGTNNARIAGMLRNLSSYYYKVASLLFCADCSRSCPPGQRIVDTLTISFRTFFVVAPRMLMTVDENLKPLSVPVRVGQAVDVVGQAGRPKTITGFQTHSTPVLLAAGDRAELATEKYIPLSSILEGFVILKKNPEYKEES
ncbi:26S proteasome non-ATPase regulatory subunit 2 A [Orobanche gracilis]